MRKGPKEESFNAQEMCDKIFCFDKPAEKMNFIFDVIPTGIAVFELSDCLRTRFINQEYSRMLGWNRDELFSLMKDDGTVLIHPDDVQQVIAEARKSVEGGAESFCTECRIKHKNGKYGWFLKREKIVRQKKIIFFVAVLIDITVRKEAEQITNAKRDELEKNYQTQLEIIDRTGDKDLLYKARFNLTRNMLLYLKGENNKRELPFTPDFDADVRLVAETALQKQDTVRIIELFDRNNLLDRFKKGFSETNITYMRKSDDAQLLWTEIRCSTALIPGTDEIMCFVYGFDRSMQVLNGKIALRLVKMEHDYLAIINLDRHTVYMHNIREGVESTNPRKTAAYDDDCRFAVEKIVVPEDRECTLKNMELSNICSHLNKEGSYSFSFTILDEKGNRLRKALNYCYLESSKRNILMTRTDITQHYNTEQQLLEKANSALIKAEKASAAKGDFLSNMSHEIRTPMNAIIGMTELAKGSCASNSEAMQYLQRIEQSGQYLLNIINDILDMSRIESGKFELNCEWCSPFSILCSCIDMVKPVMEAKKIEFITPFPVPKSKINRVECFMDVLKTQRMIMNLLNNACKFTGEGGRVCFSCRNVNLTADTSTDEIIVEDNGCGMSAEYMKRIFTPFEQERNKYSDLIPGTGLGLPLARKIARLMGGDIIVESELGKGSKFSIKVSYKYRITSKDCGKAHSEKVDGNLKGAKILLAEDNDINAEIAEKLLETQGAIVVRAENGQLAVDIFKNSNEKDIDAILMDIRMPVMDGIEAAKRIRSLSRPDAASVPIIAMTANAFSDDMQKSLQAGMNEHLIKPIEPQKMYETLIKWIKKEKNAK